MAKTLLIVDDERDMRAMLKKYFELNGFGVMVAENGLTAIEKAGKQPDLIILDINMPDLDGIEVCSRIRSFVSCPILFLTARLEDKDKLKGFAVGGDDYIVKPFSIDELGARVEAHLRREERKNGKAVRTKFDDDLVIDYTAQEVYFKGTLIPFLNREFQIIELLSSYPGQLFSKDRIFDSLWDMDSNTDVAVIMEHISRIRAKFAEAGCKPYIQTVWGSGYKWTK
ncbi:MAG: response regulator transcription factor [Syntrophomonadaceae bacterium]|nr:response regulator transcription factor [Syntrophomonadaceae bacterium]